MRYLIQRALWIVTLAAAVAGAGNVMAQGEVRAYREEAIYTIPEPSNLYLASTIGTTRLVVWGTNDPSPDSTAHPQLYYQIVRDTAAVGSPMLLTPTSGHPERFARILSLPDGFLVVWRAVKEGKVNLYCRAVDTNGVMTGPELPLGHEGKEITGVLAHVRTMSGSLIFWEEEGTIPTLSARRVSDDGRLRESYEFGAGALVQVLTYPLLPGLNVVARRNAPPVVIRDDGRVDMRTTAIHADTESFFLDADSSLAAIEGDSLRFYKSLFDTVHVRSIVLPTSYSSEAWRIISRDPSGRPAVYWSTYDLRGMYHVVLYRASVEGDSLTAPVKVAEKWEDRALDAVTAQSRDRKASVNPRCGNAFVPTLRALLYQKTKRQEDRSRTAEFMWEISPDGQVTLITIYRAPIRWCAVEPATPVTRISSTVNSTVSITVRDVEVALSVPTTFHVVNRPQTRPALAVRGTSMFLTSYAADGRVLTGEVVLRNDSAVTTLTPFSYPSDANERMQWSSTLPGGIGYHSTINEYRNGYQPGYVAGRKSQIYLLNDSGRWVLNLDESHYVGGGGFSVSTPIGSFDIPSYNAEARTTIISEYCDWRKGRRVVLSGQDGKAIWSLINPIEYRRSFFVMSLGGTKYMYVISDSCVLYDGAELMNSYHLPWVASRYFPMPGSKFLRVSRRGVLRDSLYLEMFTPAGVLRSQWARIIDTSMHDDDIAVVPRWKDGAVTLLLAKGSTVRMIHLNPDLELMLDTTAVTTPAGVANPTGVFRGDTLCFAWEDYRNTVADVFIKRIYLPPRELPIIDMAPVTINGIHPNPTVGLIRFTVAAQQHSTVSVNVADMSGRILGLYSYRMEEKTEAQVELDLDDLPPGVYMIIVRNGTDTTTMKVMLN